MPRCADASNSWRIRAAAGTRSIASATLPWRPLGVLLAVAVVFCRTSGEWRRAAMATAVRHRCSGWLGFRATATFAKALDGISPESFYGALDAALAVAKVSRREQPLKFRVSNACWGLAPRCLAAMRKPRRIQCLEHPVQETVAALAATLIH